MSRKPQVPKLPSSLSVCGFQIWDSTLKEMRPCGKTSYIKIAVDDDCDLPQAFCKEHYVDAIMQLEGRDESFELPSELEKLITKEH